MHWKSYRFAVVLAIGWLLAISFLLCLPGQKFPRINWLSRIQFDKIVHLGMFFILVVSWCRVSWYRQKCLPPFRLKNRFLVIFFLASVYGIMMEWIQDQYIPYRGFDLGDIIADVAGAAAGFWFAGWRYIKK